MANENGSLVTNGGPAPPAKPPASRVAQLGARLKAVAIKSDKRKEGVQKRPAPVLPSEARGNADKPLELNQYVTQMARGEVSVLLARPTCSIANSPSMYGGRF